MGLFARQKEILTKTKARTETMLNTIGMSENILKLIERRTKGDMLIFCLLAAGILLIMYVLYFWIKPILSGAAAISEPTQAPQQL